MNMSTGDTIAAIIGGLMVLALNLYAFRADSADAGHGRKQKLQMLAIWVTIFVGLTLAIGLIRT